MLKTGLVSISFRNLTSDQIIKMVSKAELDSIEWGGDLHVPHGNLYKAEQVRQSCEMVGISCPSYGSYYKVGEYEDAKTEFGKVLSCAVELNSDVIRVWAGTKPTCDADSAYWKKITDELSLLCNMSSSEGKDIAVEYHGNTLTDNSRDTMLLLAKTNADNLYTYWQPPVGLSFEDNLHDIRILKNHISNVHTFTWDNKERLPLEAGYDEWNEYFKLINTWKLRYCMLEFVKDNSVENFYKDAAVLKKLIRNYE